MIREVGGLSLELSWSLSLPYPFGLSRDRRITYLGIRRADDKYVATFRTNILSAPISFIGWVSHSCFLDRFHTLLLYVLSGAWHFPTSENATMSLVYTGTP